MTTQLGKYRLVRRLGAGGMGEVWEAVDTVLDRTVAVKLLTGDDTDNAGVVREAAAAARVLHPNVVALYDAAEADGRWFLVMEYVAGPTAARRVTDAGRLPWPEATRITRDVAAGLAAVHAAGFIHRDVKPGNILIAPDGTAKVADFGLARKAVRSGATTVTGVAGTPEYMSPEQCWSEAADGRTDVYSLGATYFTLLTGQAPYTAATDMAVMYAHCNAEVPDPRGVVPELPAACAAVIRRAMAKQPADRHPTADALRADLDEVLAGGHCPGPPPPPPSLLPPATREWPPLPRTRLTRRAWLAALPATAVAGALAWYWWPPTAVPVSPPTPPPEPWVGPWPFPAPVSSLAISPDGLLVAVAYASGGGDARDGVDIRTRNGRSVPGWPRPAPGTDPASVAFSPDGKRVAVAHRVTGEVLVWELAASRDQPPKAVKKQGVPCVVAFADEGNLLATGWYHPAGGNAWFTFLQADAGGRWEEKPARDVAGWLPWAAGFVPGTSLLVVGIREPGDGAAAVQVLDPVRGVVPGGPAGPPGRKDRGPALAFACDPRRVAVGSNVGIRVFEYPDWTPVGPVLAVHANGGLPDPWAMALSRDGRWLAAAPDEGDDVYVWDAAAGSLKPTLPGRATALAFDPDGTTLLCGRADGQVLFHSIAELTR